MKYKYNGKNYNKVIIWGGGQALPKYECTIRYADYIVDSNSALHGTYAFGLPIFSPQNLAEEGSVLIVVTTLAYLQEIKEAAKLINPLADVEFIADVFYDKNMFFGQYREDSIVEILLRKHTREKIQYLEIGVPDPINGSNTYHFYVNGHSGVCVEANPDKIEEVKNRRVRDKVLCCGCGAIEDEGKSLEFYIIKNRHGANTFSKESLEILKEKGFECEKVIEVPMLSLNSIMEKYFLSKAPDYISIDVEGYEYTILKDFDFNRYPVSIFCIEKGDEQVKNLMQKKGYELVAETPPNWIFMKEEWAKEHRILLEREIR